MIADPSARFNNRTQVDYGGVDISVEDASGNVLTVTDVAFDHVTSGLPNQLKWKVVGLEDNRRYTVTVSDVMVNGEARTFSYDVNLQSANSGQRRATHLRQSPRSRSARALPVRCRGKCCKGAE